MSQRYRTIVADPPWPYDEGWPGWGLSREERLALPYPSMTITEIRELPVASLIESEGYLFLWTTNRYLEDAFTIARAWTFRPRQTLVWCKPASWPRPRRDVRHDNRVRRHRPANRPTLERSRTAHEWQADRHKLVSVASFGAQSQARCIPRCCGTSRPWSLLRVVRAQSPLRLGLLGRRKPRHRGADGMTDKEMRTLRLRAERAGYNSIPDYCNTLVQALVRIADSESGYWGRLAYAALNGRDDLKVPEDL